MPPRRESIEPRAVIYARYSSDLQRDASIEDQIRLCRGQIDKAVWQYLHAYTDRASSGANTLRPAHQALLEGARRGEFDIVVAEALDRLSRDQEDVAGLLKRLRFAGAQPRHLLNIRLDTLEEMVLGGLRERLMAPELFKAFCEEFHREVNRRAPTRMPSPRPSAANSIASSGVSAGSSR